MSGERAQKRRVGCLLLPALLLGLAVFLLVDCYLSNNVLKLETISVVSARLPSPFDGLRIVHLSDLHEKRYGENNHKLLKMVEDARPDLIAITGDFIDERQYLPYAEDLCRELVKLAPVYYVTGNHEWSVKHASGDDVSVARPLKSALKGLGVSVLDNRYERMSRGGHSIVVAGVEDLNGPRDMLPMSSVVAGIREEQGDPFILMLSHRFDRFDEYVRLGLDVVLTGHAHGGLIRLPFTDGLIGPSRELWPKRTRGLYAGEGTSMVVSPGIGDTEGGFRLFNRPEVLLITLESGG